MASGDDSTGTRARLPVIRDGVPADAPGVAALANMLARATGSSDGTAMTAAHVEADLIADAQMTLRVAELAGRVAGYTLSHRGYESAFAARGRYMADLAVAPEARRRGIARALVADVARITAAEGGQYVWWIVMPGNDEAQAFYETLGGVSAPVTTRAIFEAPFRALLTDPADD
ncbi:MAG: GNAT family N-acetyltransferase [Pseudomonadota bacterium]